MLEIGCKYENKSMTYMTDGHEKPEHVLDRNEYTLRDQGSVGDPAARELAQYNWIQVTSEKANDVFAALRIKSPEAEEALRKSAYFFVSPSDAIPVDKNGIVCFTEGETQCTYEPAVLNSFLRVHHHCFTCTSVHAQNAEFGRSVFENARVCFRF
jgi:hypothetical protein